LGNGYTLLLKTFLLQYFTEIHILSVGYVYRGAHPVVCVGPNIPV